MEINTQNAQRVTLPDQTAFPSTELMTFGLSKREYFAALAMQGIISDSSNFNSVYRKGLEEVSLLAVAQADELIKALNK